VNIRFGSSGGSATDGRTPKVILLGTVAVVTLLTAGGLWSILGHDDAQASAVRVSPGEGEKLALKGKAKSEQMRMAGGKLQQKGLGDGYQFDSDGRLLGADRADDSDLPKNRTVVQMARSGNGSTSPVDQAIRMGVRHERRVAGEGVTTGEGLVGTPESNRQAVDRSLLTESMLVLPTSMGKRSGGSPERDGENERTDRRGTEGSEGDTDARMMAMMERLQDGVIAEAAGRRSPGGGNTAPVAGGAAAGNAGLYPAAASPQTFGRGQVGDMRIADGPSVVVRQGKFLDCVLVNELRVDLAESAVVAMVSRNFLSGDDEYVLVPAGAKLLGTAGTVQNLQQARVYLKFERVIFPDQRSAYFPVRQLGAVDGAGAVGLPGDVDRHLMLQFGAAIMLGVLDGLAAAVQSPTAVGEPSVRDLVMGRTSSNFATVVASIVQRYANVVPTISVEPGATMKVFFAEDVRMSPYLRSSELAAMQ
jgi:type IV secretory pathway VirB10-like protein